MLNKCEFYLKKNMHFILNKCAFYLNKCAFYLNKNMRFILNKCKFYFKKMCSLF